MVRGTILHQNARGRLQERRLPIPPGGGHRWFPVCQPRLPRAAAVRVAVRTRLPAGGTASTGRALAAGRGVGRRPWLAAWLSGGVRRGSRAARACPQVPCAERVGALRVAGVFVARGLNRRGRPGAAPLSQRRARPPRHGTAVPGSIGSVFRPALIGPIGLRSLVRRLRGRARRLPPPLGASTAGTGRQRRGHLVRTFPPPRFVLRLQCRLPRCLVPARSTSSAMHRGSRSRGLSTLVARRQGTSVSPAATVVVRGGLAVGRANGPGEAATRAVGPNGGHGRCADRPEAVARRTSALAAPCGCRR